MDAFSQEAFALLAVGLFVIGLRLCVRIYKSGLRNLQADDYLMVVAAVCTLIQPRVEVSATADMFFRWPTASRRTWRTQLGPSGKDSPTTP